jgi:hypothetical protein
LRASSSGLAWFVAGFAPGAKLFITFQHKDEFIMIINTADEYKSQFTKIAGDVLVAYNQYKTGKRVLSGLGVNTPSCYATLGEFIIKGFLSHAQSICNSVSKAYQGNTTQSFNYGCLEFKGLALPNSISGYDTEKNRTDEFIVSEILTNFDYNTFVSELTRLANGLEEQGKQAIAQKLIGAFKLSEKHYVNSVPKRTARHVSVDGTHHKSWGGYYHSDKESFHCLACNVKAVADEFDYPALAPAFFDLFEQVNATDSDSLASGTTFGCKNTVLIKVFNGHIRYSFTPEMFSAIITYIKIYAPETQLCTIPQAA